MASTDIYHAASKVQQALEGLVEQEQKKAVLMAFVGLDNPNLLCDPGRVELMRVPPTLR